MSKFDKCISRFVLLLLCITLLSCAAAWAQSTTEGAIGGTVADPQDRVIPGATVTIKNIGTGQGITIKTDSSGYYRVGQLQPTVYTVSVNATGFAPYKAENIIVNVGSLTTVNPHMTIGTTEHVDVSGEAPVVNTVSPEFAPTLNETAIQNLPINGGRWSSFSLLTPAVVSDGNGFGLVSVRGMSPLLNNNTIDGADNNQAYFSEERGRTRIGYSTGKSFVQEFQVNTSNYSAEYGRAAGGVVNTVTKSGTNAIHGDVYYYDRDNDWGSFNPYTTLTTFNPSTSTSTTSHYKPLNVRKMGGVGIGGPILKDRLFWFIGYDRYNLNYPGTAVPTGAASFFAVPDTIPTGGTPGGTGSGSAHCSGASSGSADYNVCFLAAEHYISLNGKPSTTNVNNVTGVQYGNAYNMWMGGMFGGTYMGYTQLGLLNVTGPTPRTGDQDIIFPKLDWIINQKNHASFEVNRMRWWSPAGIQTQATNAYGTNSFGNDYVKDTWGVARLDTMITNNLTNQVRFQYGRDFEFENNQLPTAYEMATLVTPVNALTGVSTGYNNAYGIPPNVYVGSFQWGTPLFLNRPLYPNEYKMQVADTVSWIWGRHAFKFGADFVRTNDSINNLYEQYAEYSFSGLTQYFAQLYDPTRAYFNDYYQAFQGGAIANPVTTYQFNTNDLSFFAQDDWKIARRLTLNLGLRYETEMLPNPYSALAMTIPLGSNTIHTGTMPKRPNAFGPRVGFAWDVFGDSKTVFRGGYGMYFGRIINSTIFSALVNTGATSGQVAYDWYANKAGVVPTGVFPQIAATNAPFTAGTMTVNYFDPKFTLPQIHEFDLTMQHQLPWNMVISVSYLGSLGRHMQNFTDLNLGAPGTPYCGSTTTGSPYVDPVTHAYRNQAGCTVAGNAWLTPPSTISYSLTNVGVTRLPLTDGSTYNNLPFYTTRLNPAYGTVTEIFSGDNSAYHALAFQLEKRFSNHLQFALAYTWSHAMDNGVNGTTGAGTDNMIDPMNPKYGLWGNSNYNVPQRFTIHAVMDSPWKHKNAWKYLLDGWQAAPMFQFQYGLPYSVATASGTTAQYVGAQKFPGIMGGMLGAGGSYQIPGTERNGWLQPKTFVFDLRFAKKFQITERVKAEFSADGFNIFNHQNVTGVNTTAPYSINQGTSSASPYLSPNTSSTADVGGVSQFGLPTNSNSNFVYNTRQIQLGFRVSF